MNNDSEIVITEDSRLFKFFAFMHETPIGSFYIKHSALYGLNTFRDVCTFVRHLILTIFIAIPLQIVILLLSVFIILRYVLYLPFMFVYARLFDGDTTLYDNPSMVIGIGCLITFYLVLCGLSFLNRSNISIKRAIPLPKINPDSFVGKSYSIVSSKHRDFCQRIRFVRKDEM